MSHLTKVAVLLIVSTLFSSVYAQSLSDISATIRDSKAPLERSLKLIDKLHLSNLNKSEEKMALKNNVLLQEDIYKRMVYYRDQIKNYSDKLNGKKSIDQLKIYLADYNSKLVRVVSIFFNFHKLYGKFPTMPQVRSLNLRLSKSSFVEISDLINMKAKHISDDEVEVQVKEIEYVQIASSTYLSNAENNKDDFAHLVQFMATQQTLVNRGQLSKMDAESVLGEDTVNKCMKRNLYLGEQTEFRISEHILNKEDATSKFYSKFYLASEPILNDLAEEDYFTVKEAHDVAEIMKKENIGQAAYNVEFAIQKINESIDRDNKNPELVEKEQRYEDKTEEGKKKVLKEYTDYLDKLIPRLVYNLFKNSFNEQKVKKHVPLSLLSGDNIDKAGFLRRVRKSYEKDFYSDLAKFVKKLEQKEGRVDLKAFAPVVTRMMNKFESKLDNVVSKYLPKFSLDTTSKSKQLDTYVEQEMLKAYPYMKSMYFTRFAEKSGENINKIYNDHSEKKNMKVIPDNPRDLMTLGYEKPLVKNYELCPEAADKVTSSFFKEVEQSYNELLPFTELAGANPNDFFSSIGGVVELNEDALDKVIFAHIGEFVEKRAYPKALRDNLFNGFMKTFKNKFDKYFTIEVSEVLFNAALLHDDLSHNLSKLKDAEPFLNELKSDIYPALKEEVFNSSSALILKNNKIDREKIIQFVESVVSSHIEGLGYPADNKNRIFLQKQFAELTAYAQSGDKKYLSDRMKRYLISKSGHNGGRYGKGTASAILQAGNKKRVYNSISSDESTDKIMASLKKTSKLREALLWNVAIWKLGEYADGFNLQRDLVAIMNKQSVGIVSQEKLLQIKEVQQKRTQACKLATKEDIKKNDFKKDISSYSQEQVKFISYKTKGPTATTTINFERPKDLFTEGDLANETQIGHNVISNRQGYRKLLANMIKSFGLQEGFKNSITANVSNDIASKYWLSAKKQALIAKNRLNELYAASFLMRTPYKLGTSGVTEPTAFRLLSAYDISNPDRFDQYEAKQVIKDTVRQALENSKGLADNWCKADYKASSGSDGETYFREIYRHAPLIREQVIAEIEMIESRRSKDVSSFIQSIRTIDKKLDSESKTTMERLYESLEMISMIAGLIMIAAMLVWGIGWFVGGAVFAIGKAGMAMTMNHVIFAFFIVSFASRMHHLYLRVPAQLNLQHKIATTQVLRPLYTNWDELETKMDENGHERNDGGKIAMHIAEGVFQGMFAFQIARIPFVRYSASKMVSIMEKAALPVSTVVRPLHKLKHIRYVDLFKPKHLRGNLNHFKKSIENVVIKILEPTEFIAGKTAGHVAQFLEVGLRNRGYMIASKHARIFSQKTGKSEIEYLKILKESLNKGIKRDNLTSLKHKSFAEKFADTFSRQTGMKRADAVAYLEKVSRSKTSEHYEMVKKAEMAYENITLNSTEVLRNGTWFEEAGYAISHWLKRRQFMSRSYIKRFQNGTLSKDLSNAGLMGRNPRGTGIQAELDDAFNTMMRQLDEAKDNIRRSMIKKIDLAESILNSTKAEHEIFRGRDIMQLLFDPKLVNSQFGEIAFNSAEVSQFVMTSMTSTRFGSFAAKLDYAKLMMMEYPVLMRRLKSEDELSARLSGVIVSEQQAQKQPIMLMAAKALQDDAGKAVFRTEEVNAGVKDHWNILIDKLFKVRLTQKDTVEIMEALSMRKELYGDSVKFKAFVDKKTTEILKRKQLKIGKKSIRNLTILATVLMLQEDIGYKFEELKSAWSEYTDQLWGSDPEVIDWANFQQVYNKMLESDLLTDEQSKALADKYELIFKENFKTIEELEASYDDFKNYEDVKAKLYTLLNDVKPAKVEYIEEYNELVAKTQSLGLESKSELENIKSMISQYPVSEKEYDSLSNKELVEYYKFLVQDFDEKIKENK